jgi:hypothetical protein
LFGGASFLVLPLLALVPDSRAALVLQISVYLSFLINYPHFAHSYQIFYRGFSDKLAGRNYSRELSLRYFFAGVVVPVAMIVGFLIVLSTGNPKIVGSCAVVMFFFVGWHYVKQGYGLLMVDSALKRHFFNDREKKIFRINAYACWIFFFALNGSLLRERNFMGLKYYLPPVSRPLLVAVGAAMLVTTIVALYAVVQARRRSGPSVVLPIAGYTAYFASLYVWLCVLFSPAVLYAIPAFHSLQYLAVVWKFESNRNHAILPANGDGALLSSPGFRFAEFVVAGVLLGMAGFWLIPLFLDTNLAYDRTVFGSQLSLFFCWIFINVHHYFLDNVMWRKDNPDVRRYLLGAT